MTVAVGWTRDAQREFAHKRNFLGMTSHEEKTMRQACRDEAAKDRERRASGDRQAYGEQVTILHVRRAFKRFGGQE